MEQHSRASEIRSVRIEKAASLRRLGIDPYPSTSARTHDASQLSNNYATLEGQEVSAAGRLMAIRKHGKLTFGQVEDESGRIQVMLRAGNLPSAHGTIGYGDLSLLDIGDIVECTGILTRTRSGEISVDVARVTMLAKALRPLPDKWSGLKDDETRVRLRHLDFLLDAGRRERIRSVSAILFAVREFLHNKGFTEIQTPVLQPQYGGGRARPFTTDVWALQQTFFLAISHELYLKRMIIGGFERVFTIGRYFRNEGIDRLHNPEFNMLETMSAYASYEYNMDLIEELYQHVAMTVLGTLEVTTPDGVVDLSGPWRRVSMVEEVARVTGVDFAAIGSVADARSVLRSAGVSPDVETVGHALVDMFEHSVAPHLFQPTIVYGHPVEISPLAKLMSDDRRYSERFELFIAGAEQGDNWSELNDPQELYSRLVRERDRALAGDEEAHSLDLDFISAMEWGMPPTTGLGPGIERLAMLLTGARHIGDVVPFPLIRRKEGASDPLMSDDVSEGLEGD